MQLITWAQSQVPTCLLVVVVVGGGRDLQLGEFDFGTLRMCNYELGEFGFREFELGKIKTVEPD